MYYLAYYLQVMLSTVTEGHRYIKARCTRETSQNNFYNLWALVDGEASVISGSCDCTADDSACKHFAALLFSLASFTDRHRDRHTLVGTDVTCMWDKPRKEGKPMECDDIDVRVKHREKRLVQASMTQYTPKSVTSEMRKHVEKSLKKIAAPGSLAAQYLSDSDDESDSDDSIPTMQDCVASSEPCDFLKYLKQVYTEEVVAEIEEVTRGQAETEAWSRYRSGHLTSTAMYNVEHVRSPSPSCYIVDNILGLGFSGNQHTEYGHQMEVVARNLFVNRFETQHKRFKCCKSGLKIRPDMPHLAASPDGIVSCSCCVGDALLEIKSPSTLRNKDIQTVCKDKGHKRNIALVDGCLKIVDNGPWDTQIQFAMGIARVKKCFLVVYTNVFPYIHVTLVDFRDDDWASTCQAATSFYTKYVIPRLFVQQ